jgi:hypothetical protein
VSATDGRSLLLARMPERAFQEQVIVWAKRAGWRVSAMHDSRRQFWGTDKGIPDLTLVRGERLVYAELKFQRKDLTPDQEQWLAALRQVQRVETYGPWRPLDEDLIKAVLK